ncbi:hypothetical protein CYLTODRAFT_458104 [Cylindrobasidium torrendii FP15055 ss-10]|uniref:Uncharacterized protein n=1 Tax=Cylindrobasidium torrendii FP15055 ss-10 TaxID=1314674 RepID=A0A0D7AYL9_9AGAR|nr:hypothetical protein CYLTODRAFT_458104 [Cylindrobasidium torrendii FP15055 ss-10]
MAPTMDARDLDITARFMFLSLAISLATVAFHRLGVWVRVARVLFPIIDLLRSGLKLYLNANALPSDWALYWKDTEAEELKECQDAAANAEQKYKDLKIQLLSEAETIEALSANVAGLNARVAKQAKEIEMWQKSPAAATDARVVQLQELLDDAVH